MNTRLHIQGCLCPKCEPVKTTRRRLLKLALSSALLSCTPAMAQVPTHSDKLGTFDPGPGNFAATGDNYLVLLVPADEEDSAKWRLTLVAYNQPANAYMFFTLWQPDAPRTLREQLETAELTFCQQYGYDNEDLIGRMYGEELISKLIRT